MPAMRISGMLRRMLSSSCLNPRKRTQIHFLLWCQNKILKLGPVPYSKQTHSNRTKSKLLECSSMKLAKLKMYLYKMSQSANRKSFNKIPELPNVPSKKPSQQNISVTKRQSQNISPSCFQYPLTLERIHLLMRHVLHI
jgi:hypothetical protein